MFRIKRLYTFVLESFLPLLLATFSVCLFILLMQFVWKYVDDMVGKGVDMKILAELFFYAGLTFIPMALPLAILLASLMAFGNLGESLELLAMKSSGVSLLRIMRPLIILVFFISVGSFYFQNNILPSVQGKFYTILLSLKQKSPELDIPEGSFFKDLPGYNVYVRHKDKKGGMMRDLMIYDYSKGFENAVVIVADSGKMKGSEDKKNVILTLYNGESFQNLGTQKPRTAYEKIPYRRETFGLREMLIPFDMNFNMVDESIMQNRDMSKDLKELSTFIDSVSLVVDSIQKEMAPSFKNRIYTNTFKQSYSSKEYRRHAGDTVVIGNFDDYFSKMPLNKKISLLDRARGKTELLTNDYLLNMNLQSEQLRLLRGHKSELHKKFTYALACLLFFFIGAPFGAIIRKGGLGMPAVLSVVLFLSYYIIDTFGLKLAKQDVLPVWQGMWMSTAVLASLGAFFTYKAVNDSVVLNPDAWKEFFKRFFGQRESRNYTKKEVIMTPPDYKADVQSMIAWNEMYSDYRAKNKKPLLYIAFWKKGFEDPELHRLINSMESFIEDLKNSDENLIIGKLMDYPIIKPFGLEILNRTGMRWTLAILFPIGLIIYFIGLYKKKQLFRDLDMTHKVNNDLKEEISRFIDKE